MAMPAEDREAPPNEPVTTIPEFNPSKDVNVQEIKDRTEDLIKFIQEHIPNNRRRAIALTNYEQAAMWAVKACFP